MHPTFEPLETRRMMSAALKSAVLRITGTEGNDQINLTLESSRIVVRTNGKVEGRFARTAVKSISIDARGGNDLVFVAAAVNAPAALSGGAGDDTLVGGSGNDTLRGGDGDNDLRGGDGTDTADYATSRGGVDADLVKGTVTSGLGDFGIHDRVSEIERVNGSAFQDTFRAGANTAALYGNGEADTFFGFGGASTSMFGGAGDDNFFDAPGPNLIDGGAGADTVSYAELHTSGIGVMVTLDGVDNDGAHREGDNAVRIENVFGTDYADKIVGDANANLLDGRYGDDTIVGGAGNDTLRGDGGDDNLDGGDGADALYGHTGNDTLTGGAGRDALWGEYDDDVLYAKDFERDYVNGGSGVDRALVDRPLDDFLKTRDAVLGVEQIDAFIL